MPYLDVPGCALYYTDMGSGTPILFIHGTGANADIWGEVSGLLAAHHRVITYDRRGFSRSANLGEQTWEQHFSDAVLVLQSLGTGPAVVVGWSSGGPIALEVARRRPDLVSALVLVEPAMPLVATLTLSGVAMMLRGKVLQLLLGDRRAAAWFYRWATAYRGGGNGFDRMAAELRLAQLENARASMEEIDGARRGAGHLGAKTLRGIAAPAFCVLGEKNAHGWYRRTTEFVAKNLPNGVLRPVAGAAHGVFLDQPESFASVVEEAAKVGSDPYG